MQCGNPDQTWKEWLADNTDRDEATKLGALREYIARDARAWADSGDIGPGWANKKLPKLGITDLIPADNYYQISAEITGKVTLNFHATNRSDALRLFADYMTNRPPTVVTVANIATTTDPVVVDGPEDPDPAAVAADAPQTVDATLLLLREIIMLGHVSGPKFCESGANGFLAGYGLAPIPERKTFTVQRPVEAVMKTTVTAYDEASAQRVASWRWENDRAGFEVTGGNPLGDVEIAAI